MTMRTTTWCPAPWTSPGAAPRFGHDPSPSSVLDLVGHNVGPGVSEIQLALSIEAVGIRSNRRPTAPAVDWPLTC
jgi:hypothetical protein